MFEHPNEVFFLCRGLNASFFTFPATNRALVRPPVCTKDTDRLRQVKGREILDSQDR